MHYERMSIFEFPLPDEKLNGMGSNVLPNVCAFRLHDCIFVMHEVLDG